MASCGAFPSHHGSCRRRNRTARRATSPVPLVRCGSDEMEDSLETGVKAHYDFRKALMMENDKGMKKIYNDFHDPNERDPQIAELRRLHAEMDRAVFRSDGWPDFPTDCEVLFDYEIDEETWGRKKKPRCHRWPHAARNDVLARRLVLIAVRGAGEKVVSTRLPHIARIAHTGEHRGRP